MKKNMGNTDKAIRLIIAALILIIIFTTNLIVGWLSYLLIGLAAIFILTSFVSFCPLYTLFGFNSCPKEK